MKSSENECFQEGHQLSSLPRVKDSLYHTLMSLNENFHMDKTRQFILMSQVLNLWQLYKSPTLGEKWPKRQKESWLGAARPPEHPAFCGFLSKANERERERARDDSSARAHNCVGHTFFVHIKPGTHWICYKAHKDLIRFDISVLIMHPS